MKLAAWHLTVFGGALLTATGSLRAQTLESLPAPTPKSLSSVKTGNDWSTTDFSTRNGTPDQRTMYSTDRVDVAPQNIRDGEFITPDGPGYCDEPRVFPYSTAEWWRDGCWYGAFDFVIWNRTQPSEKILGIDANAAALESGRILNKHGNALPLEPGGRATLGYILDRDIDNRDHSVEFTYLGFNNWEGTDSLIASTPQTLRIPASPNFGGFNFSDFYTTTYRSSLQSMEFDYRIRNRPGRDRMIMGPDGLWSRQLSPGRTQSLLLGFRAISEEEQFRWLSLRNNVSPDTFSGDMKISTRNWLFGVQAGGDCLDVHDTWFWGLRGDAGIYCNFTDGFGHLAVVDPTTPEPTINSHPSDQLPAFFGELSFMMGYNLSDHLMLRTAWDFALLGGVAVAPDQASFHTYLFDKQPFLSSGGQIFYTGLSLGLEAYW